MRRIEEGWQRRGENSQTSKLLQWGGSGGGGRWEGESGGKSLLFGGLTLSACPKASWPHWLTHPHAILHILHPYVCILVFQSALVQFKWCLTGTDCCSPKILSIKKLVFTYQQTSLAVYMSLSFFFFLLPFSLFTLHSKWKPKQIISLISLKFAKHR